MRVLCTNRNEYGVLFEWYGVLFGLISRVYDVLSEW